MTRLCRALIATLLLLAAAGVHAPAATPDLAGITYQQKPGSQVPLGTLLQDETGQTVPLRDMVAGRPTILALGYFHCPSLCGVVRDDLLSALSRSGLRAGRDYSLVVLSIDPQEKPVNAIDAKREDLGRYNPPDAAQAWHYLLGAPDRIQAIEDAVGFHARFNAQLKQFLHPTGIVFLTGTGIVSSYLLGVGYQPGDVSLAVTRARAGGIAKAALPVLLLCFHFDPATGRYTLAIAKLLEVGCVLTVLTLGGTIALALRRDRRVR